MKLSPTLLLVALLAVAPARADVGPPAGKKLVPVTTIVEVSDAITDYAFFEIAYSSTPGPPPHGGSSRTVTLHYFVPGTTIRATGARHRGGRLYAVPLSVAEQFATWIDFATAAARRVPPQHVTLATSDDRWFVVAQSVHSGEAPGGVSIPFGTTQELPTSDPRDTITVNYRLSRGSAGIAFVREGEPDPNRRLGFPPDAAAQAPRSDPPFPWRWVVGFVAILLGGLCLVLRSRKAA